jgi:ribosomal protein S12 methylthiotransferase accessory factor
MDMEIRFPGKRRVDAEFQGFSIETDQSVADGGDASAPTPMALFLASIGTCAGMYVLGFCRSREIDTAGLTLGLDFQRNPDSHMVEKIVMCIGLPPGFPEKYEKSVVRAAEQCFVKKHLAKPPEFEIVTQPAAAQKKP